MNLKAVIFDFDGVIVDSETAWEPEENQWFSKLIPEWSEAEHNQIVGLTLPDTHAFLRDNYGLKIEQEEFIKQYHRLAENIYKTVPLIEGVDSLIRELHSAKVPQAIASSSPKKWILKALGRFQLEPYFDSITSGDEIEDSEGKPEPTIFLKAASKLGLNHSTCIVIEDSENGVISAKRAGMKCIGLNRKGTQDLSKADLIIANFENLNISHLEALIKTAN